jgi:hypothetical protein
MRYPQGCLQTLSGLPPQWGSARSLSERVVDRCEQVKRTYWLQQRAPALAGELPRDARVTRHAHKWHSAELDVALEPLGKSHLALMSITGHVEEDHIWTNGTDQVEIEHSRRKGHGKPLAAEESAEIIE